MILSIHFGEVRSSMWKRASRLLSSQVKNKKVTSKDFFHIFNYAVLLRIVAAILLFPEDGGSSFLYFFSFYCSYMRDYLPGIPFFLHSSVQKMLRGAL